ncbi:MAG TPA: hypothetical protein VJA21_33220 [Verrucomicrobiae bacterium]
MLAACAVAFSFVGGGRTAGGVLPDAEWSIDFRYSAPSWQTAICLPDDWQKTLVGRDGSLLYDYPGKYGGFGTRATFEIGANAEWVSQELISPRIPVVRTIQRAGVLEITQEAFAVTLSLRPPREPKGFVIERAGSQTGQRGWASPSPGTDPAMANVAIGWNQPIRYRFKAKAGTDYSVAFGLCEGWHEEHGQRMLLLQAEGGAERLVDMVQEKGRNKPGVFLFAAHDQNGDGWIDLTVSAATNSPDQNTFLNTLWVFAGPGAPPEQELVSGTVGRAALAHLDCSAELAPVKPPRYDILLVRIRNTGSSEATIQPQLRLETDRELKLDNTGRCVNAGPAMAVCCSERVRMSDQKPGFLRLEPVRLPPRTEKSFAFEFVRGTQPKPASITAARAGALGREAERYWRNLKLPYGRLQIPDRGLQALVDSSIRNIYQAREIKNGLPAFQVGPTCYRGLWVVDGSFLLEAITYLGRANETRSGIEYLMSFQRPDGGFMLIDGHWKETGIVLWAITRHAQLTGDKAWLRSVWPRLERGFAFIRHMRSMPAADTPNARLIPDGFSDGGLADKVPEYTNIYWTLAGLRAAVEAARWLGNDAEAADWQREYDDFLQAFRRAAERDLRQDSQGKSYLPIRMKTDPGIPPQKAQWAFLHSIFPGKVFAPDDPLVGGNMAMLKSVESQGLVFDTGWLKDGIWTYFGSFYGHAWLWLGDGEKAARTLYAFGNHASPLLCWREEQMPVGKGSQVVGDMPHNWASAEFIRLVRHSLILERGRELHLLEAAPPAWIKPGAALKAIDIATEFGPVSLELKVARDGSTATLSLTPPKRNPPERIVLHLDHWSAEKGVMELPTAKVSKTMIKLRPGP